MNAEIQLKIIAKALKATKLEAVMIGNSAAALHGAPVTTLDFDFMFRKTPGNLTKLKKLATMLDGVVFKPYYPVSDLFRVSSESLGLQLDFMGQIHGIKSFASLRSRAEEIKIGSLPILIASLEDIITSKSAANRRQDRAVLPVLRKTFREKKRVEN